MCKITVKPLGPNKLPVNANLWLVLPRCIMAPALTDSFSATPGKTEIQIVSLGGRDPGTVGQLVGVIDLTPSVDLSVGAPNKIDVLIDGTLYPNINVTGAIPAATTAQEILDAINTAVGVIVATLNASDFLVLSGLTPGQTVTIDDPSDASTSAVLKIFDAAATPPESDTGNAPFDVPVQIRGDETAV